MQKGRHEFQNLPSWAEDQCEAIQFQPYIFYPHQKIHIQLTVNHVNYTDAAFVHEAVIPWVESVNSTQFTACVTRAGRMTTLQIALPLLIGSPTKGLPLEVWPGRKSFLDGGLELVVRR